MATQKKKAKVKKSSFAVDASDLQWPVNTRTLFRPDRYQYIMDASRKNSDQKSCVFCLARDASASVESLLLYKSPTSMVLLNKFPYNAGHLLVLPQSHVGELTDLPDQVFIDLHVTLRKALKVIQEAYKPAGVNIGMNLGRAAGAGIPEHLHYHIVPRWMGDLNFFPLIGQSKTLIETLEQTFQRLLPYFK